VRNRPKSEVGDAEKIASLFETSRPILVEVRFPRSGTSSDWYLCDEVEEFQAIVAKVAAGTEFFLDSVWDLTNPKGGLYVKK